MYWKKLHTCGHLSDRPAVEMCRPGILSNAVCNDIGVDDEPRKSHFPCWQCIRGEARAEAEVKAYADREAVVKAHEIREQSIRERHSDEQRAKEDRIRREAREQATREREEEAKIRATKEKEEERLKKDGGLWIETGSGKKGRGKKAASAPATPFFAPPTMKSLINKEKKQNENLPKIGHKKDSTMDPGGRAGVWGHPKKILSRKENDSMAK